MATKKDYELRGIREITRNLNRELEGIKIRSRRGMIDASIVIHRSMETKQPKIPADTGNLRHSWFTHLFDGRYGPGVLMGFTAAYAIHVHEMIDEGSKKINWNRPGSGPKFFEKALDREQGEVLKAIGQATKF